MERIVEDGSVPVEGGRKQEQTLAVERRRRALFVSPEKASASFKMGPRWGSHQDLAASVGVVASVDAAVDVRPIVICPIRSGSRDDEHGKDGGVFL